MAHRLQFRRDTRERWLEIDPVLMEGEIGFETDTHNGKIGDGVSKYSELEYSNTIAFESITQILGQSTTLVPSQKLVTDEINRIDEAIGSWDFSENDDIKTEIGSYYNDENEDLRSLWGQMRNTKGRLSKVEEYVDTIYLNQIDDIAKTANDFLQAIQNKKEYAVMLNTVVVGRLTMISDNINHTISQILTTHFLLNEDGTLSTTSHNHNKIFIYHRVKHINDLTTWSAWEEYNKENETTDSNQTKIISQHDTLLNPMTLTLNGDGLYEKGTTQTINLTWSAMKGNSPITPVSLLEVWVNDVQIPVNDVSYSEQITESKRFKVMAKFSYDVLGETVTISDTKYASATFVGAMWFGFSEYDTMSEIDMTTGTFIKQPLKTSPSGTYTFYNQKNGYLWLCIPDNMTINKVTMSGFDVPVTELNEGGVPGYRNFRSDNELVSGNYTIVIS